MGEQTTPKKRINLGGVPLKDWQMEQIRRRWRKKRDYPDQTFADWVRKMLMEA